MRKHQPQEELEKYSRWRRKAAAALSLGALLLMLAGPASGDPTIRITSVPAYGQTGVMRGVVEGVTDFSQFRVAPYIQMEGAGFWTKPTFATPTVVIGPDGSFSAPVATGGIDDQATILCAALVAANYTPPQASGNGSLPSDLQYFDLAHQERYARTFEFAGLPWAVKQSRAAVGPGANRFSADSSDVFVDEQGLHLTVTQHDDGLWYASEVFVTEELGWGTYSFITKSALAHLDPQVTFGAFTWDPWGDDRSGASPHREIDWEDSRWSDPTEPTTSQTVVQPFTTDGNLERVTIPASDDPTLTRFFSWRPKAVDFTAATGQPSLADIDPSTIFHDRRYAHDPAADHYVPTEGGTFRLNLWPNNWEVGHSSPPAPASGQRVEVVISDFTFFPLGDANLDGTVNLTDFGIVKNDFGQSGSDLSGDLDGSLVVDLTDFGVLKEDFGRSSTAAVPEPPSAVLTILGLLTCCGFARKLP